MKFLAVLCLSLAYSHVALAADAPATDASVRQLMVVMQSRNLLDGMMGQMDSLMQTSMEQALGGVSPSAEQQAVMDDVRQKMVALLQEELKWETLEPKFVELYRQSFTEEEVLGMIEFYGTPTGEAVINKMPVVMQHSMAMMQDLMTSMMPKIQKIEAEATAKLR